MTDNIIQVLEEYSDLYAEYPPHIYNYFDLMMKDEKPSVHIEIFSEPISRVLKFKKKLEELGLFVYRCDQCLSVSKIDSIAFWLSAMDRGRFARNAGAVGLLLGYDLKDIINYIRRTGEDEIV
jgi:hypothetical protein